MSSLYSKKYADKYETNKYIWENEDNKNSAVAKKANAENEEIRKQLGIEKDTMDYNAFKNARANYSDYYEMADSVSINPEYKKQSDALYDSINNFTYDAEDDPNYVAFANAAKRESQSAQKNTYANMTKASGGRNNSYAAAATAQVGQAYAQKISDYAKMLADEAYDKLVKKYELSNERYNQEAERAENEYKKYIELGDAEVKRQRNTLKDQQESKQAKLEYDTDQLNYDTKLLDYDVKLDNYKAQLIKNKILNAQNEYEYERWLKDPNYEIKDKKLAEAIGDYAAYSWLKQNGRDYLYSKYNK